MLENVGEEEKPIGYPNGDDILMQCAIAYVLVPQVLGDLSQTSDLPTAQSASHGDLPTGYILSCMPTKSLLGY